MQEPCHVRNQVYSDGTMRTWKWPMALGEGYFGEKVVCTVSYIDLTESRRQDLIAAESRRKSMDESILAAAKLCWWANTPHL
jgi:hypothetical protein